MTTSFTVGVHVVDRNGAVLGGVDGLPGRGNLGTPLWQVGPTYADPYDLPIRTDVPAPQLGRLLIGVEQQVLDPQPHNPGYLRPVPVAAADSSGKTLTPFLGRFRIGQPVTTRITTPDYRFANDLGLLSATVTLSGSNQASVALRLQALRSPLPRLVLFAHLLDAGGKVVAAAPDAEPLANHYPTDLWLPGEIVVDTLAINLPPALAPGGREIEVGIYALGQPDQRLTVTAADGTLLPENRIILPLPALAAR